MSSHRNRRTATADTTTVNATKIPRAGLASQSGELVMLLVVEAGQHRRLKGAETCFEPAVVGSHGVQLRHDLFGVGLFQQPLVDDIVAGVAAGDWMDGGLPAFRADMRAFDGGRDPAKRQAHRAGERR